MARKTLRSEVNRLLEVLDSICAALEAHGADFTDRLAEPLRPLVNRLRQAVVKDRSRDKAEAALWEIKQIMHEVNAADTKGEMGIFSGDELDVWWELSTIFQESRFSEPSL